MLIRFTVKRKDNGQAVPGARIEIEKAETVGFTDNNGYAEIVTFWSGNWIYSVTAPGYEVVRGTLNNRDIPILDFSVSVLYNAISPPSQPGPKEEIIARVGTSCSIINNYTFSRSAYQVRHDRNGNLTSLHMDLPEIRDIANRTAACFEIPPPPPKTTDEIGAEVTTLQKMLNTTVGKLENLGQAITDLGAALTQSYQNAINQLAQAITDMNAAIMKQGQDLTAGLNGITDKLNAAITKQGQDLTAGLNGIWDNLETWLIDRIIGIILKALDNEVGRMK